MELSVTEPHITSNVAVDPGSIAAFSTFLDQMHTEIAALETRLAFYADEHAVVEFGAYQNSDRAYQRHLAAVRAARDNAGTLADRTAELVHGTGEIAKQYSNLSELNASRSTEITTTLSQPVKEA